MARLMQYLLLVALLPLWLGGCATPKGVYHTVQRGQTLYRISRVYQVDANKLARINRLRNRSQLQVGQRLFVPGANRVKYVPATAVTTVAEKPSVKPKTRLAKSAPGPRSSSKVSSKVTSSSSASIRARNTPRPVSSQRRVAASKGTFGWPLKGTVVKRFGQNGRQANKGIEISAAGGSAVVASAAGKVTYSGNGIKGFGNLIILKHDDSYFTVYGFNQRNLVRTGNFVSKGQRIALAGRPPSGGKARLHFEIRRGKEAVNPLHLLP